MARLLDLFCGAGGAAVGYHRAGFTEIVGVDLVPQPRYPFTFVQADALTFPLDGFDAIHASPPCQSYSKAMRHLAHPQPKLLAQMLMRLYPLRVPWVVENVEGAPLVTASTLFGQHGAFICGSAFGLRIRRHRLFESNYPLVSANCRRCVHPLNPHCAASRRRIYAEFGRSDPEKPWRAAMDVAWMTRYEAREAIPPAYTEYIGTQLLEAL